MNFEEYFDSFPGRKKKKRKLVDIDVDEITLCQSPAIRKTFMILKGKKMDEILKLIKQFTGSEVEVGKSADPTEVKEALKTLLQYSEDLPAGLKDALDTILKSAYGSFPVRNRNDDFPSIPIVGPAHLVDKMVGSFEDNDSEDENDDDDGPVDEWG